MSNTVKTRHDQAERATAAFPFSGFAVNMWWPWHACCRQWNAGVHDGIAMLTSEWQDFVSRRLKEDFALLQQIGALRSPDQVWGAYFTFWQKAAEDYSQELPAQPSLRLT